MAADVSYIKALQLIIQSTINHRASYGLGVVFRDIISNIIVFSNFNAEL